MTIRITRSRAIAHAAAACAITTVLLTPWKDNRLGWLALPPALHRAPSINWIPALLLLSI